MTPDFIRKLGFRTRLFIVCMLLTLAVVGGSGVYLNHSLHRANHTRLTRQLQRVADALEPNDLAHNARLAALTQTQITYLSPEAPEASEATRPQVRRALGPSRVARVHSVDQSPALINRQIRRTMALATLIAVLMALLISGIASHILTQMLRGVVRRAHQRVRSEEELKIKGEGELGGLAISLTHVADALDQSVEALAHERDRFESVLESMNEGVITLDPQRNVTLTNQAAHVMFEARARAKRARGLTTSIFELLPAPALLELLEDVDRGQAAVAELTLPGTQERVVMARLSPMTEGSLVVLHDVTSLRALERMRRDFVANVSHELRTPVSVILANSETLLEGALEDPVHAARFVQAMHRNAERLSRLISDLLDIARIEAGRFDFELESLGVMEAVLRVMDVLEDKIQRRHQTVSLEVDIDHRMYGDAKAIDQVLYNLIDNASKYTPQGGALLVRSSLDDHGPETDPSTLIEVVDDGPGLDATQRTRIFERFYRVDAGRNREHGGTGLGLAIVKHLIGAMGGRVGVRPNEPKGSVFWFRMPQARPTYGVDVEHPVSLETPNE